jgi:hypothetical protein
VTGGKSSPSRYNQGVFKYIIYNGYGIWSNMFSVGQLRRKRRLSALWKRLGFSVNKFVHAEGSTTSGGETGDDRSQTNFASVIFWVAPYGGSRRELSIYQTLLGVEP